MRNEMTEPRCNFLDTAAATAKTARRSAPQQGRRAGDPSRALAPSAVDEVFADETAAVVTERGSRRDMVSTSTKSTIEMPKRTIDEPHVVAMSTGAGGTSADVVMLQSLTEQVARLQLQQEQIRRMLEQAERRSANR